MASRTQRGDLPLAVGLLFLGAGTLAVALRRFPAAFVMFPALEGALTMGIVGFLLALGAGLTLRRALVWTAPAVLLQVAFAVRRVPSFSAAIGLELALLGGVGLAMVLFERAAESRDAAAPRTHTARGTVRVAARTRAGASLANAE